jgi:hypothetical protein
MINKLEKLADKLARDLQNKINKNGIYENAGQNELRIFEDKVNNTDLTYPEKYKLKQMFINKIENIANNF